jgi:hypothetical protein
MPHSLGDLGQVSKVPGRDVLGASLGASRERQEGANERNQHDAHQNAIAAATWLRHFCSPAHREALTSFRTDNP